MLNPGLPGWREVVDESLRRNAARGVAGSVSRLAFRIDPFLKQVGARQVFKPRPDALLMHLSHPMLQRALSMLTRRRFPGTGEEVSRWTVRPGEVPDGADAVVLLSIEELAVNDLRETFHHWVRTVAFPVRGGKLGAVLPHVPAAALAEQPVPRSEDLGGLTARARSVFEDIEPGLAEGVRHGARRGAHRRVEGAGGGRRGSRAAAGGGAVPEPAGRGVGAHRGDNGRGSSKTRYWT